MFNLPLMFRSADDSRLVANFEEDFHFGDCEMIVPL